MKRNLNHIAEISAQEKKSLESAKKRRSRRIHLLNQNNDDPLANYVPFNPPTEEERRRRQALDHYIQEDDEREEEQFREDKLANAYMTVENSAFRGYVTEEELRLKTAFSIRDMHFRIHIKKRDDANYEGPILPQMLTTFKDVLAKIIEKLRKVFVESIKTNDSHQTVQDHPGLVFLTVVSSTLQRGLHTPGKNHSSLYKIISYE